jgi:hypothetical protein
MLIPVMTCVPDCVLLTRNPDTIVTGRYVMMLVTRASRFINIAFFDCSTVAAVNMVIDDLEDTGN